MGHLVEQGNGKMNRSKGGCCKNFCVCMYSAIENLGRFGSVLLRLVAFGVIYLSLKYESS